METLFTREEIQKTPQKLKNNKSTGPDGVHAEYLKYESNLLLVNISDIRNKTSETAEYPEDDPVETLNPPAKPPKRMKRYT